MDGTDRWAGNCSIVLFLRGNCSIVLKKHQSVSTFDDSCRTGQSFSFHIVYRRCPCPRALLLPLSPTKKHTHKRKQKTGFVCSVHKDKFPRIFLFTLNLLIRPFQIITCFSFSIYISFVMHLDIHKGMSQHHFLLTFINPQFCSTFRLFRIQCISFVYKSKLYWICSEFVLPTKPSNLVFLTRIEKPIKEFTIPPPQKHGYIRKWKTCVSVGQSKMEGREKE